MDNKIQEKADIIAERILGVFDESVSDEARENLDDFLPEHNEKWTEEEETNASEDALGKAEEAIYKSIDKQTGNDAKFTWDEINEALTGKGYSPAKIADILIRLSKNRQ